MKTYIVLLRGINVGGKNKIPMAELRLQLEKSGCRNVSTYIQSGNVLLQTELSATEISRRIEAMLSKEFRIDSQIIKVLALTQAQLQAIVDQRPPGFGDHPDTYHSDVIFLMDINTSDALAVFAPREGVDKIWPGKGVIYSQRLSAELTKSRLSKIVATPAYKSMTIRSWNTTTKLLALLKDTARAAQ